MKLAIVIPVYNEGKIIKNVIDNLPKEICGINEILTLVVDDGSTDNSIEQITKTKAILIALPVNLGYGGASMTGLEAARILNADIIVTFDGDGQHDPNEIKSIIKPILEENADLVIGVRNINAKEMPRIKQIGNKGLSAITSILSGHRTSDSQSGFKAFSKQAMENMKVDALGYEFCSEMIIEAKRQKIRIREIPVKAIYTNYSKQKGQSVFNGINLVFKLLFKKITRVK